MTTTSDGTVVPAGPIDTQPVGIGKAEAIRALDDALAGAPMGEYDERIRGWISIWDASTIVVIASMFERARQCGYDDGKRDALHDAGRTQWP
jgi:hypothetical protein